MARAHAWVQRGGVEEVEECGRRNEVSSACVRVALTFEPRRIYGAHLDNQQRSRWARG